MTLQAVFHGKVYTQPSSATYVNSSAMTPVPLGSGGIAAVIGSCMSGQPGVPQLFASPGDLKNALGSGAAYDAARAAFTPTSELVESNPVRPRYIFVVRTDAATQSQYLAKDYLGTHTSMTFLSDDYGSQTNSITVNINTTEAVFDTPTTACVAPEGIAPVNVVLVDKYQSVTESYSNLGASSLKFSLAYTGGDSPCVLTVNSTGLTTVCGSVPANNITADFAKYRTISQLVAYIESRGLPYTVANESTDANTFLCTNLDYFDTADIVTSGAVGVYAVTKAISDAINPVSEICTVTASAYQHPPVPATGSVNGIFSGGSTDNSYTYPRVKAALDSLVNTRINYVCGTMDADVDSMGSLFAAFTENMQGHNECRAHLGLSANITFAAAKAYAAYLNAPMVNLWFQGPIMSDDSGNTVTYSPWMQAAMMTGMQAGMPIGSSLVNKSCNVYGYSYNKTSFDVVNNADAIILARLSLMRFDVSTGLYKCVRALSSYVSDGNPWNTEPGVQSAENYAVYNIRTFIHNKYMAARELYSEAGSTADSVQRDIIAYSKILEGENVIVPATVIVNNQKKTLPPLVVDSVSLTDDVLRLRYGIRPINCINYIFHDIDLMPTSSVAQA